MNHYVLSAVWIKNRTDGSLETAGTAPNKFYEVELEGVEPSSKQGNNMLSTRLVIGGVFEHRQDRDRQPAPYPLKCRHCIEACNG